MMPLSLPDPFGPFRIVRKLGAGGMGDVYLAHDTRLARAVALKIPRFGTADDALMVERFHREARIAAQVPAHPSLCPVHEVGCIDGIHFLSMAYIEGHPLSRYLGEGCQWHPVHAVSLVCQLAEALGLLHARGIVHRDLKASNVVLQPDGRAVLLDFGLARSFVSHSQQVTAQGQVLGTPGTMAPEQIVADEGSIGPPADVWALGMLLYHLLTGRSPWGSGNPGELGMRILCMTAQPPSYYRPGLDARFDRVCALALAKKPAERPVNAHAYLQVLQQLATLPPEGIVPPPTPLPSTISRLVLPAKRLSLIGLGAASVLVIAVVVGLALGKFKGRADAAPETGAVAVERPEPPPPPRETSALAIRPVAPLRLPAGEQVTLPLDIERTRAPGKVEFLPINDISYLQWELKAIPAGVSTGNLTIRASPQTPAGTYSLHLLAVEEGHVFGEQTLTVIVAPRTELALDGDKQITVEAGKAKTMQLTLAHKHLKNTVRLAQKAPLAGVQVTFKPNETIGTMVEVEVQVDLGVAAGKYTLEVRAQTEPGLEVIHAVALFVHAPPAEIVNSIGMRLALIPKGTTLIGPSKEETVAYEKALKAFAVKKGDKIQVVDPQMIAEFLSAEQPQHPVDITQPFYLGIHEVTQAQYKRVRALNPSTFRPDGNGAGVLKVENTGRWPVENVTWEDAEEFCARLSALPEEKAAGRSYRLPTSAEWEHAARGGSAKHQTFHHGNSLNGTEANVRGDWPFGTETKGPFLKYTNEVGKYAPNAYGLYDLHGNVWEWCSDRFDAKYYREKLRVDPQGPQVGKIHVRRGGSWDTPAMFCRTAFRMGWAQIEHLEGRIGFRVVCVPKKP